MKRWWESEQEAGNVAHDRLQNGIPAQREQGEATEESNVDTSHEPAAPGESEPAGSPSLARGADLQCRCQSRVERWRGGVGFDILWVGVSPFVSQ